MTITAFTCRVAHTTTRQEYGIAGFAGAINQTLPRRLSENRRRSEGGPF